MFTDTDVEASDSTWGLYEHRELVDSRRERKILGEKKKNPILYPELRNPAASGFSRSDALPTEWYMIRYEIKRKDISPDLV